MSQFSYVFFRQLALLLAIFLTAAFSASATAAAVDADTNLTVTQTKQQIENLKSSLADLKDSHRQLNEKYIQIVGQQNESNKTAFQAKTIADTYTDTAKSIWIPLMVATIGAVAIILGAIYFGIVVLAKHLAEELLREGVDDVLKTCIDEPVGQKMISSAAEKVGRQAAKDETEKLFATLCGTMLALTFLRQGRQDLVETILDKLRNDMPQLNGMLAKQQLLLVLKAYDNVPSKRASVLALADAALAFPENKDDADTIAARVIALRRLTRYDEAATALRHAVSLNSPNKHVYQWALAYCLFEGKKKADMPEAIAAARCAYFKLQENREVILTLANCLAFSDETENILVAKQLVMALLQKDKNDKNPVRALIVWRGITDDLQKAIQPKDYGFAQLLPQT